MSELRRTAQRHAIMLSRGLETMTKPVIDIVKGMGLAASRRKGTCLVKVDLGEVLRTFFLKSSQINWLIEDAPAAVANRAAGTNVKFESNDWNGDLMPTVTELQYVESSDGIVTLLTLNRADQIGLFFSPELWSQLIGLLVQYRAQLQIHGDTATKL